MKRGASTDERGKDQEKEMRESPKWRHVFAALWRLGWYDDGYIFIYFFPIRKGVCGVYCKCIIYIFNVIGRSCKCGFYVGVGYFEMGRKGKRRRWRGGWRVLRLSSTLCPFSN
eukprot:TRINITY_DN69654_c0_g1_i1.p1 TRINITY_DN69654_c0_g1~~TRINITY_DN69654_c0_g1_i1.p1  ORF type:complete len:113 (-),score=21.15 TRINITY_DN69654_c0_g1_i1:155-493(-)